MASVIVVPLSDEAVQRACLLAERLGWDLAPCAEPVVALGAVVLRVGASDLSLGTSDGAIVRAATAALQGDARPGKDLLRRAIGAVERGAYVLDATAGLGRDGFLVASRGLDVVMLERVPVVALLLEDALEQGASGALGAHAAGSVARVRLVIGDAIEHLDDSLREVPQAVRPAAVEPSARCNEARRYGADTLNPSAFVPLGRPAVVMIDPMYPDRGKTALPAKGMALFRTLVGKDEDADRLLRAAIRAATRRVVVKRPLRAAPLAGLTPSGSIRGSTIRWDIYPGSAGELGVASSRSRGGNA